MFRVKSSKPADYRIERYVRYGIRKFTVGVASVAIAAGLLFLGRGAVFADVTEVGATEVLSTVTVDNRASSITEEIPDTLTENSTETPSVEIVDEHPVAEVVTPKEVEPDTGKTIEEVPRTSPALVEDKRDLDQLLLRKV